MILYVLANNFDTNKGSVEPLLVISCDDDTLVRQLDKRWNRFCLSLYLMQGKLADLGVVQE